MTANLYVPDISRYRASHHGTLETTKKKSTFFKPNISPLHPIIFTAYSIPILPQLSHNFRAGSSTPSSHLSLFRLPMHHHHHHHHIFPISNSMTTFSSPVCVQVFFPLPMSLSPFSVS
jgi:Putative GTPases (G3E family)